MPDEVDVHALTEPFPSAEERSQIAVHCAQVGSHMQALAKLFDPSVVLHKPKKEKAPKEGGEKAKREPTAYNLVRHASSPRRACLTPPPAPVHQEPASHVQEAGARRRWVARGHAET